MYIYAQISSTENITHAEKIGQAAGGLPCFILCYVDSMARIYKRMKSSPAEIGWGWDPHRKIHFDSPKHLPKHLEHVPKVWP